jgi:two-component system NtrC family sensor kinase
MSSPLDSHPNPRPKSLNTRPATLRKAAGLCALVPIVIPIIVLVGWALRIVPLVNFIHGLVAMNPVVAVLFITCGVLLRLSLAQRTWPRIARFRVAVAAIVFLVAAIKLFDLITGHDTGIDQILFYGRLDLVPGLPPNRMAPNTALAMVFAAAALFCLDFTSRRGHRAAEFFALSSILIALTGFLGYTYRVTALYNVPTFIPMALHAAICFLILNVGILFSRPDQGLMGIASSDTTGGMAARRLLPAAIIIPIVLGWLRIYVTRIGLLNADTASSVRVILDSLFFAVLIWYTAGLLRRSDDLLRERNIKLVQAEKLAGLGQMVAGVAHEINNPLSFVGNNVAVLQRDVAAMRDVLELYRQGDPDLARSQPELAQRIRRQIQELDLEYTLKNLEELTGRSREGLRRIQQIVKDLRDFARLDQNEAQQADLNAGIESTINIIQGRAKKKQVTIQTQLAAMPPVECSPAKINQVVLNLIANAIDASKEGGIVTVRSRTESRGPAGDFACIDVIDTGCGISPEHRGKIFDPFFTTKPQGEGTGLGLSISYGIIHDHQGTLDVDSTPGKGSRFTIRLPMRPVLRGVA